MSNLGCGFSLFALVFAVIGAIPLIGWLNWFTTLPASILAIIFSWLTLRNEPSNGMARAGLVGGVIIFCWTIFRLGIGGGIV